MDDAGLLALRASGWAAALALVAALAASPLARLAPQHAGRVTRARRSLGIAAASLALVHSLAALAIYVPIAELWPALAGIAWLRSGALALALLAPMLVTSFPPLTRALRVPAPAWKPLHRLGYAAVALVTHHLALGPFAPRSWVVALAIAVAAVLGARLIPRRDDRTVAET